MTSSPAIAIAIALAVLCSVSAALHDSQAFARFKETYAKSYATAAEEQRRLEVFSRSLRAIDEINARHPAATFAVNKFSDMSEDEWASAFLSQTLANEELLLPNASLGRALRQPVPAEYSSPFVTPVRKQGCHDFWAFAAVAALETAWFKANGIGLDLSEQAVRECSHAGDCSGGSPVLALQSIGEQGGLPEEVLYPYRPNGDQGECRNEHRTRATLDMWGMIKPDEGEGMELAEGVVTYGALIASINAGVLQHYTGGIIEPDGNCTGDVNHAALIVGYTRDTWVLKNSWGADWGEKGFFRLRRGRNACSIASKWAVAVRSPVLPEDSGHAGPWEGCTASKECATSEGSEHFCRVGDRRCLTDGDCDWANSVDHTQRDCMPLGPFHLGTTPRWHGCTRTRDCVAGSGTACHVGDRRCLTDDDCAWANYADKKNRNCSQAAW
eukprot:m51a1_g6271 putative cysteine proteinase (441) ;mRNA; r:146218-147801